MISAWFLRLALGLLAFAVSVQARATPSEVGTLDYRAPAECPTRVDFSAQVAARTIGWLSPTPSFAVTVAIERDAEGLVGRVTFARAEQRTVRQLRASGCNELVDALAFIVAVLIDPQARATPLAAGQGRPPPVYLLPAVASARPPLRSPFWFIAGPEVAFQTSLARDGAVSERLFLGLGRGDGSLGMSSARWSFGRSVSQAASPISGARRVRARDDAPRRLPAAPGG
jgi:hypothetical protein